MIGYVAALTVLVVGILLARRFSPQIYDLIIIHMTETWYRCVLELVPEGSRILDVGIGTGTALLRNKELILSKRLTIVGVDYNLTYVKQAQKNIAIAGLQASVSVIHASIYDSDILSRTKCPFDVAYFSGSFSLLPQPAKVSSGNLPFYLGCKAN